MINFDLQFLRSYRGVRDLPAVLQFIGECNVHADFCAYMHPGNFTHHLSNGLRGGDPSNSTYLYEDEGAQIRALIILSPGKTTGYYDLMIDPRSRDSTFEAAAAAWSKQAVQTLMQDSGKEIADVGSAVLDCDIERRDLLLTQGYTPENEASMIYHMRSLQMPIPDPVLPDGFTIRNVEGEHEADALGMVHSGAFSSNWPSGEYLKVMRTPGFHIDRELIVVAPDGRFAAFLIYWIDPVSKSGLFEPVGCHKDYQQRGLSKALMYEGMRRMIAQGMGAAIVETNNGNEAALALYRSVGFEMKYTYTDYRKPVG